MGIIQFLGFTTLIDTVWNLSAYTGVVLITVAILSKRLRKKFLIIGPFLLFLYSLIYFHNYVFAGLQFITTISGILNYFNVKKSAPKIIIVITVLAYILLLAAGQINNFWTLIGSFGLLGVAFGVTQLPGKRGIVLMAAGDFLLIFYAIDAKSWVFLILNIISFGAKIFQLTREDK